MSLQDVGRALRHRWLVVVATILVALAAGGALYVLRPPTYTATLTVYAAPRPTDPATTTPDASYQGSLLAKERIPSYLQLVTSPQVVSQVIARTGSDESVSDLTSRISATSAADSVLVDIAVQEPSAAQAVNTAEAMAQVLPPAVDQLEQSGAPGIAPVSLRVIRPIPVPDRPSTPGLGLTLGLALLAGVVLGIALALVRAALDRSVRTTDELGAAVGLPVLGAVPARSGTRNGPARESVDSEIGEAYGQLHTALHSAATPGTRHGAPGVLVVTSPGSGQGRTTSVANLAVAAAGTGASVLVVDADLRRPRAARLLAVDVSVGLTDVLSGQASAESVIRSNAQGIDVLAPGQLPTNPGELLSGGGLAELFAGLRERYTLVLVDVPPVLPVTDAVVVAAAADGAVVLGMWGTTSRDDLAAAVRTLETAGARPVGAVLVGDPQHRDGLPPTDESRKTILPRRPHVETAPGYIRTKTIAAAVPASSGGPSTGRPIAPHSTPAGPSRIPRPSRPTAPDFATRRGTEVVTMTPRNGTPRQTPSPTRANGSVSPTVTAMPEPRRSDSGPTRTAHGPGGGGDAGGPAPSAAGIPRHRQRGLEGTSNGSASRSVQGPANGSTSGAAAGRATEQDAGRAASSRHGSPDRRS